MPWAFPPSGAWPPGGFDWIRDLAECEALYTESLLRRVDDILKRLVLTDAAKISRVRTALILQYPTLRARDEAISAQLKTQGKPPDDLGARAEWRRKLTQPLHEWFLSMLALDLTAGQIETIKDALTYNKVTFDAYCPIMPGLKHADKAKIMKHLKVAREEAIEGGSAPKKTEIFLLRRGPSTLIEMPPAMTWRRFGRIGR